MTFTPKTPKLKLIGDQLHDKIVELDSYLGNKTCVYIDRANVFRRQNKLGWHIDRKRLYQFLGSFEQIDKIRWYYGTLNGDKQSEKAIAEIQAIGYDVITKPVKIMYHSIDVSSIGKQSPDIIKQYLTKGLLQHFDLSAIEKLNTILQELNNQGLKKIEERKCNFDVEIGVDMILDFERATTKDYYKTFVLRSGDSDFADIVNKLIDRGCKVYVFTTSQRISKELAETKAFIYDIQKIKEFICRNREISIPLSDPLISI